MGCGNCGSGASGKPSGCKSNGGCSTGGCNRMNVFDWLSGLPLHDSAKPFPIIEVSFSKGSRKDYYRNNTVNILEKGEMIAVEGVSGFDIGQVSLTGELVKLQMKKYSVVDDSTMKRVLRLASEEDLKAWQAQKDREQEVMVRSRAIAKNLNLDMKVCEVEIQADGKKATFFYTANQRVDFRELIKLYAGDFKVKVEMRQIGARQESAKVGGIGSCGRELCCSTWLTDFKSVNTTSARYQNLSINQAKLSGQCGRLKCCLNYELDTYMDALRVFPDQAESIQTAKGTAYLQKRDIFKSLMWYSFSDSNKQYPMSIVRVKEILKLNKEGVKPEELQAVELETSAEKKGIKVDVGFVNDVGQITLKALEKGNKKKKPSGNNNKGGDRQSDRQNAGQNAGQQGGPQQAQGRQGGGDRQQGQKDQQARPQGQKQGGDRRNDGRNAEPQGQGQQPRQGQGGQQGQPKQGGQQGQPKQDGQQGQPKQGGQRGQRQGGQPRPQGEGGQQARPQGQKPNNQQGEGQQNRPQRQNGPRPPRPDQNPNADQGQDPNPNTPAV